MKTLIPDWPAPSHVKAFTTLRYPSELMRPDHDPDFEKKFSLPSQPVWLNQIHSAIAVEATSDHLNDDADASYSKQANHICTVLTADCLPILLCNQSGTAVAAIHAGWKGLAAGVIENTVSQLNIKDDTWLAWLGPAIGPNCFEVGNDVWHAFVSRDAVAATAFKPKSNDKWLANLYQLAKIRLLALGISNIYGGDYCTYTQSDLFYSYRRDHGETGRMATLIWIADTV